MPAPMPESSEVQPEPAIAELTHELELRENEITALRSMLEQCQSQLALVQSSTIWRLTAPLRFTVGALRGDLAYRQQLSRFWHRISPQRLLRVSRALLSGDRRYWNQLRLLLRIMLSRSRLRLPGQGSVGAAAKPGSHATASRLGSRIIYVSGEPDTPGHRYRVERYAVAARTAAAQALVLGVEEAANRLGEINKAQVLVIWRAIWSDSLAQVMTAARTAGVRIIFDVDDLMIDPEIATLEIIDGIRTQELEATAVREHYRRMREVAMAADLCTCPTERLAAALRKLDKPALVLRNGFDADTYDASRTAVIERHQQQGANELIRLGYAAGTRTHQRDFRAAASAIARILRAYPQTRLVLFHGGGGPHGRNATVDLSEFEDFADLQAQIEWRKIVALEDLPKELARFDINLAPLEIDNPFCEAKSELKFFEAALVDVPTVASSTGPYRAAIEHGCTGFLAESSEDWFDALKQLVTDSEHRTLIARNALHSVLWRYGPEARTQAMLALLDWGLRTGVTPTAPRRNALGRPLLEQVALPDIPEHDILFLEERLPLAEVAVVMPVYNYAHYLPEALESVKAQTLQRIELVLVDDCSTDDSLAVARQWLEHNASRFQRVALLKNRKNAFLGSARNAAIAFAQARFVMPLDPDNTLLPDCLDTCLKALRDSPAALAYPLIQQMGDGSHIMGSEPWSAERLRHGNYIDAMLLLRKSAWAAAGGYENLYGWEDYDLWCKFVERGFWGIQVPEVLAQYRVHQASMLKTLTHRQEIERKLYREILQRHPWLDRTSIRLACPSLSDADTALIDTETPDAMPALAVATAPETPHADVVQTALVSADDRAARLAILVDLLQCPLSGERLRLSESGEQLISETGRYTWPVRDGRPILFPALDEIVAHPASHLSNPLCERATRLIADTSGLVLNLSAGGSSSPGPNVIEAEAALFRNTDLVADSHHLPFQEGCFDLVIAMNAFEHYANPEQAAREIHRVLRPGGRVFIHTAFLQPLHEPPYHFYNCTKYGLERWFADFDRLDLRVSDNFTAGYSIAWLLSEAETLLRAEVSTQAAKTFTEATVRRLMDYWRDPASRDDPVWQALAALPQPAQERIAAGFEYLGCKGKADPITPLTTN
ncbi:glycosyltransferase [Halochromatium salexigens]|nr:glycosyltransferase [Halochromatium salexigens]